MAEIRFKNKSGYTVTEMKDNGELDLSEMEQIKKAPKKDIQQEESKEENEQSNPENIVVEAKEPDKK
ncbi:hypothetical protein [Tetragenococcus halophilus]|uniref:hypothetical protein n=1 Tax=Tetragenococcus halophilus TaxID=51669 RepID=UPI00300FA131